VWYSLLVDLVSWFLLAAAERRGFGSCRSFFDVRFRSKKYAGHIFRAESEALAERRGQRPYKRKSPANAGVED
jgi:hypothetical protein